MASFSYKAVSKDNVMREGVISALTLSFAKRKLHAAGDTVLHIEDVALPFWKRRMRMPSFGFSESERITFFRNLAAMMSSGLSLSNSLDVLGPKAKSGSIRRAIAAMSHDVANGKPLSESMKPYVSRFSPYLIRLIRVGELAGELSSTLDRIADDLERDYELKRKVMGALAYPLIVIGVMIGVIVVLSVFVLPKIAELFEGLNAELPLVTKVMLDTSSFIAAHPALILTVLIALVAVFVAAIRTKPGKYAFHAAILRIPLFGDMEKEFNLARFFRAMHSLIASGVSLVYGVEVASETLRNGVYQRALRDAGKILIHGVPLSDVMKPHPEIFPEQTQLVVRVGEQTGKYEEVFKRVTVYFERSLNHKTAMLTAMMEPFLILLIGIVVGGLALSIFLPIYQVANVI